MPYADINKRKACNLASVKKMQTAKRKYIKEYKLAAGCTDCGYNKYSFVLELDHIDSAEKHPLLRRRGNVWTRLPWGVLYRELALCEVRCANCHRVRHHA